ncbi:unnamed protein product [Polarella glacialis]|uniref:Light-independent protochlorophyllide reductase iron-sulfur ATP-binding protein n=1 Tax=Polarella glacialis TaxID=89957 RepID=A0A813KV52_POLGL|nr:unnamed protein product [Polarella glacialis]
MSAFAVTSFASPASQPAQPAWGLGRSLPARVASNSSTAEASSTGLRSIVLPATRRKSNRSSVVRLAGSTADAVKLAVYGKGGIGKSTTSCNISVALAHDSTFTLTGFLIPTIIEKDYHYENVWPEDVIYKGYGGYVVGETVKLLKELNAFYEYDDVILFDVLGDVVCGGFAAPLNYADYCMIVTDNGFDALFAANRIGASVREKARTHPLRLAGLIGNRTSKRDLIDKYVQNCPMPVLEVLPLIEDIRVSRVKGKTLFELAEKEPSLKYVCDYYLNIADQLLAQPEGVVPKEVPDRELFSLLSDFYLTPGDAKADESAGAVAETVDEVSFV